MANGCGGQEVSEENRLLIILLRSKITAFCEAVETIMGRSSVLPTTAITQRKMTRKKLLLSDKSASTDRIYEYLYGEESTTPSLISVCVKALSLRACHITTSCLLAGIATANPSMPLTVTNNSRISGRLHRQRQALFFSAGR